VGSWIFVSNIVGPVLANIDRIGIATGFPIAVSGWYGVAAEVAGKQLLFTGALQPVFFPALAAAYKSDPDRAVDLMWRATRVTLFVVFGSALVLAGFSAPLLRIWMRSAYSPVAARVLPWLAIAVFINAVAQVPISALQGAVHAKGVGVMFLLELPLYIGMIALFGHLWGVVGVAFAFLGRVCFDAVGLWWILAARFPASRPVVRRTLVYSIPAVAVLVAATLMAAG
jgi:O-antigen/teichoic acid export membrane protein